MDNLIVPAIIAKTQSELETLLNKVKGLVKRVQLDVMDGEFVPNSSLNFDFKLSSEFEYEVHLMVNQPLSWIKKIVDKVNIVILHVETLKNIELALNLSKSLGLKTSLALNPATSEEIIFPFLSEIDGVLIMTVDPGSYCVQKEFKKEPLEKIRRIRQVNKTIPIEVDGCMNPKNAKLAKVSGANVFASGSYILKSNDVLRAIKELETAVE